MGSKDFNLSTWIHEGTRGNPLFGKGFTMIVTIGCEELSKFLFFSCPCERPWNFRAQISFYLLFMSHNV